VKGDLAIHTIHQRTAFLFASAILLLAVRLPTVADEKNEDLGEYTRASYTKFEHRIPMRDGVKLFTAVYVPNDRSKTYPILLLRTPYSVRPYGADQYKGSLGPSAAFAREGFIFVYQDVRGKYMSGGEFVNMRPHVPDKKKPTDIDESTDTYDTIEWLLGNIENHNSKVGQWGISYPGFYAQAGMIDSHPALAAVSPQASIADWFWDDMHHHGAFILPLAFRFFASFGQARPEPTTERSGSFKFKTPDGYQFFLDLGPLRNVNDRYFKGEIAFWNEIIRHPNYDAFWQSRNILPHLRNVKAAVLYVGGWFDTEDLYGPLKSYAAVEKNNPGIFNMLVMGPWDHGGWSRTDGTTLGTAEFGFKTAEYYREQVELPFFKHFLKGEGMVDLPEALVFETGANRWRHFDAWPPKQVRFRDLYLRSAGKLAFEPASDKQDAYDDYISDPAKPVPYTMEITNRWAREYMTEDQRFAAWRPDVLVYQTEALTDDLTLAGPIQADLWVATSGSDSDWIVKVIDVFPGTVPGFDPDATDVELERRRRDPGGRQMLVRAEVMRGRFRNSYEKPEPFVSNRPTQVSFELQDILHTFKRDHRLMVQVQSTWFPFVDRNPQKYVPNIFEAKAEGFVKVTNRVYRSAQHPSRIRVRVLD